MSARKRARNDAPMEQDSFLDIVANLVGILIILVVIFGAQIGEKITHQSSPETAATLAKLDEQRQDLVDRQQVLDQRDAEYRDWQSVIDQQAVLIEQRRLERHLALRQLAAIEYEVQEKVATLTQQQQMEIQNRQIMAQQANEIQELTQALEAVQLASMEEDIEPEVEIIEHYPTPIAQTVFGREVHFHLRDNKIVFVPFDELVQRLRATWETHAEQLPIGQTTTETLEPIGEFRLQYELGSEEKTLPTANGVVMTRVVELKRFWLLPVQTGLGETIEQALTTDSEFSTALQKFGPKDTTVSIWVYPESYTTFLELRKALTKQGYRVAVWPLTPDQRISGSPDGLRASAQ